MTTSTATRLFDNVIELPSLTQEGGKSNEWYTPARYIEAAREVMGGIDLDPASCARANETVKAEKYYTKEEGGLAQEWYGRVWLNPPFGKKPQSLPSEQRSTIGAWVNKLVEKYQSGGVEQAILLVTARTDARWFRHLWEHPICFADHSVRFSVPYGCTNKSRLGWLTSGHNLGCTFVYLGPNEQKFTEVFSQFGRIAKAIDTPRQTVVPLSLWEGV